MDNQPKTSGEDDTAPRFVAFDGVVRAADGDLADVAVAARRAQLRNPAASMLVFDLETGAVVDLDLRGTEQDILTRYSPQAPSVPGRGRPKLGVVAREVTLLPRHWDWLSRQPGGASVTLRRLVEAARKADSGGATSRARAEAAYRFMSAMAGDRPGFEDAARALFAGDRPRLTAIMSPWPADICEAALRLFDGAAGKA